MTTPNITSSTDSQMHNNIMAAGSRDRPPMLAPGRYPQWRSRFLRYVDTRPNGEALRKCILSGPYKPTTVLVQAIEATDDSSAVPEHTTEMWKAIERLQQGQRLISLTTSARMVKQYQNEVSELCAEKLARNSNPLALLATAQASQDPFYQSSRSYRSHAPSSKPLIPSRSHISTRHKGKEIAKLITPPSETALEEDSDLEQAQRDKDMQKNLALIAKYFKKIYKPTNNNLRTSSNSKNKNVDMTLQFKNDNQSGQFGNQRTECRKPKRVKDSAYHKEKMLMRKQAEQGVPLQAEQYDWLANMDEEVDEQELKTHYSYMAKIQEVPTTDSGTDSKPVEHVQNDAGYNVFANNLQHSEQSESINNTCLVETDDNSQIHNNIMATCSKDRPPMLAPGRYPQWRSRFLRYVDIRPNGEALRKCILSGPYKPTTVLVQAVEAIDDSPARDKDMQKNLALIAKYFKKIYKPTNNNLRTSSNSKNKNVDMTPQFKNDNQSRQFRNQRTVNVVAAMENVGSKVVQQSGIQCFNCKEYGHFAKECRKPKMVKDSAYHKEKMLLCNKEAHYSYMAKIQEVPIADSGTDSEPVEQIQKQLKKANITLAQELKECKAILAETSKSLEESISVRDSCLVVLQTKQAEFEKYKAFNDRTVEYDKLKRKLNEALGQLAYKDTVIREEKQLNNEILHEKDFKSALGVINVQFDKFIHSELLKTSNYDFDAQEARQDFKDNTQIEAQSLKDLIIQHMESIEKCIIESARHKQEIQNRDDTDIRHSYDTEPMVNVPYTAEYNVFVVGTQHSEKPESINNTCVVEKFDSNVIPDSPDMCNNDIQTDQNAEDERAVLANLIANLKIVVDENKKIQNQLNKANTSLAHELKDCKSILAETSRTLGSLLAFRIVV
nr:hypothetical protein [Tanacetum cinerariifolium]